MAFPPLPASDQDKDHLLLFVGGFNCLNVPFGSTLGIFTILVLVRDSVRVRFESGGTATGS